jgi:hypothetical protein
MKVNSVRVHDPIGDYPRQLWDNLQPNHLNRIEPELRVEWPAWRDKWLKEVQVA